MKKLLPAQGALDIFHYIVDIGLQLRLRLFERARDLHEAVAACRKPEPFYRALPHRLLGEFRREAALDRIINGDRQ